MYCRLSKCFGFACLAGQKLRQYGRDEDSGGVLGEGGLIAFDDVSQVASPSAAGMSSKPIIGCHHTTTMEEKPSGMAIMCSARLTGCVC